VQRLVAQRSGKLTAVLRNPNDRMPVGDKRLDVNMLLGLPTPQAPVVQVAAGPRPATEVIVGGRGPLPANSGTSSAGGVLSTDAAGQRSSLPSSSTSAPPAPTPVQPYATNPSALQQLERALEPPTVVPLYR
jgi:hypothetical protein